MSTETLFYPINKILLPTDGSEHSLKAARYTVEIAKRRGSTVTLLHVLEVAIVDGPLDLGKDLGFARITVEDEKKIKERALKVMERTKEIFDKASIPIELKYVCCGKPAESIVNLAEKGNFNLIVIGHRGVRGAKHALLGSVAEKVCRNAPCPVLVVR